MKKASSKQLAASRKCISAFRTPTPYHLSPTPSLRGMTLIDIVVGVGLMVVVFFALYGTLRASLLLSSLAKAKATATSIAGMQMESLRSLSYDNLGTLGGIPPGPVSQTVTAIQDNVSYTTRTFIAYIDDPADGTGSGDTNGITTDYKRAKVTVSYVIGGRSTTVALVSNFAPPSIEATNGGGTLQVNVVSATGSPMSNALVTVVNNSTSPTINLTTTSNADGIVYLPGAATSSQYQIAVTNPGYSSAQTYARAGANQNPSPGYLTVVKNQTTASTFAIDLLSSLTLGTYSPAATSTFTDTFSTSAKLTAMSSTTVSGGSLTLLSGETAGSATSIAITPAYLASWGDLTSTYTIPSGATLLMHVYDVNGNLLPDTVLSGNIAGFSGTTVYLEKVATTTYPSLMLGINLSKGGAIAPSLQDWSLSYVAGPTPIPNVSFTLTGAKTIGTTAGGAPIYKTTVATTTASTGLRTMTLEWDAYSLAVSGYDVVDGYPLSPYAVNPGTNSSVSVLLGPQTTNSLLVAVTDTTGSAVSGAGVTLTKGGYSATATTSTSGVAYFGNLSAANYTVKIVKTGYTQKQFTNVSVSGASSYNASFP